MAKSNYIILFFVLSLLFAIPVFAISNVQHSVDGNKVTLSYQGTPPFWINIRGDTNVGQAGGYLWTRTYSSSFSYDMSFAINPSKKFYYGIKDTGWSMTNEFLIGQSSLKSSFYKNDPIAINIIKGENYLLKNSFYEVNSFEFKLMNSLKQLGFSRLGYTYESGQSPVITTLNRFRKIYGIQPSNYLDKTTLILLDNELVQRENEDKKDAATYPPFSKFINGPTNEPSKNHLGMLFARFFGSLPEDIQTNGQGENNVWEIEEFRNSLAWGLGYNLGKFLDGTGTRILTMQEGFSLAFNNQTNFMYCNDVYYAANPQDNCLTPTNLVTTLRDDLSFMTLIAHEFGHGVGAGTYLNNIQFNAAYILGNISYIMNPADPNSARAIYIKKRTENNDEFISGYAKTNHHEDFAESFSSYMFAGRIFRERAKNNIYLKQKYDFLKTNIFKGKEFETGSLSSYSLWNSKNNGIPFHTWDYFIEDPDWRWDYIYVLK